MTIYVDELRSYPQKAKSGGRFFGSGKQSCHMMTDGEPEELHQFAERIGLKRAWYQDHPSHPHYDLTPSKRAQALRLGAQERTIAEWVEQKRGKASPLSPAERAALTALEQDGWTIEYSPFLRAWTLKKGTWTTVPHPTPREACEAAQELQEAAERTMAEQERQRVSLQAYLKRTK